MQAFSNRNSTSAEHEKNNVLDSGRASDAREHKIADPTKVLGPGVEKEEEDEYEKMLIAITGKCSMERSTKDKAVKFPQKVSTLVV